MNKDRFMSYVKTNLAGCWIWNGSQTNKGYGKCRHNYGTVDAHRMSYRLFVGPIPTDKIVRHTCDVKLCVNPAHLLLGTYLDNMKDAKSRGRLKNFNLLQVRGDI